MNPPRRLTTHIGGEEYKEVVIGEPDGMVRAFVKDGRYRNWNLFFQISKFFKASFNFQIYPERRGQLIDFNLSWLQYNTLHRYDGPARIAFQTANLEFLKNLFAAEYPEEVIEALRPSFTWSGQKTHCEWYIRGRHLPIDGLFFDPKEIMESLDWCIKNKQRFSTPSVAELAAHHNLITRSALKAIQLSTIL